MILVAIFSFQVDGLCYLMNYRENLFKYGQFKKNNMEIQAYSKLNSQLLI